MNSLRKYAFAGVVLGLIGLAIMPVAPVIAQAVTTLSTGDKNILNAIKTAVEQVAIIITDGAFPVTMLDENGQPVVWAAPSTGNALAAASVSTAAECWAAETSARERYIRSVHTNTADIYFMLDSDGSPTLTAATAPFVLHPGDQWTNGKDGYTGAIYCLSASGTQSLARGYVN